MRALTAQARAEVLMMLRRGESVLLTLGIPVALLAFFATVDVLPLPRGVEDPVEFLAPGVLALAVLSSAFVGVAIATGFERSYNVLKRLGATPLGRPRLVAGKVLAVIAVEVVQVLVLAAVAVGLGWRPVWSGAAAAAVAVLVATVAFTGLGMLMAGTLPAMTTLAAANGIYLLLLLTSGMVIPLAELPAPMRAAARALPAAALSDILSAAFDGVTRPGRAWLVLLAWAIVAPLAAARWFRWE